MIALKKSLSMALVSFAILLSGCARDLSSNVYTSDSTLSLTLEGKVVAVRPVIIKNTDQLSENSTGMAAGGIAGGVAGSNIGHGHGNVNAIAGGLLAGALIGSMVESQLSTANGIEYIIKVDPAALKDDYYMGSAIMRNAIGSARTSGLLTIVQGKDQLLSVGQDVYVIISSKRARIISK